MYLPRIARILIAIAALVFGWFLVLYSFLGNIYGAGGTLAKILSVLLWLGGFGFILQLAASSRR